MRRPFVQALLGAIVGGLLVLSLPAIADVATRAAEGNADKLDGFHANALNRGVGTSSFANFCAAAGCDPSADYPIATAEIRAPKAGWLMITGGADVRLVETRSISQECYFTVDGLESAVGPTDSYTNGPGPDQDCRLSEMREVPKGDHTVRLWVRFTNGTGAGAAQGDFFASYPHLEIQYIPFDGDGKKSKCTELPCP